VPTCADQACGRWRPRRQTPHWSIGTRLNGEWFCSRACVQRAARTSLSAQDAPLDGGGGLRRPRLGVLLRQRQVVTQLQLADALRLQRESGRRLGDELQRLGWVDGEVILRALAQQHSVNYLTSFDVARVTAGPSWLPASLVRALGLVPFDVDEKRRVVHVVCAAPVPRAAGRALQRLTGWGLEMYLVRDEIWDRAIAAYQASGDETAGQVVTSEGVDDAAALVADTALAGREVTMQLARWRQFAWVRVEGSRQTSNVLVPIAMEGLCQAAPIVH
jgi:hypothetical protein